MYFGLWFVNLNKLNGMHELALCRSILGIGVRACGGRPVSSVTVDVGALRQVVGPTLVQCWEFVTPGTPLAGSRLVVNDIPAVIKCVQCGAQTLLAQPYMICGTCGSGQVDVVTGREFLLRSIDVGGPAPPVSEER